MKIYTKTGDNGTTSDVLGNRVSKGDMKIELQGSIDEISAGIGYLRALLKKECQVEEAVSADSGLREVQYALFRIGGDVSSDFKEKYIKETDIEALEHSIDKMSNAAGELTSFIYYSGCEAAAYCHVVRTVARRAERVYVRFLEEKEYNLDYQYINRLSDYLFSMARYLNLLMQVTDEAMKMR
ncbi:MAG TPA: cob(I)yrinic acid a,c-diamide adenosyltransferase [Negativicutes bacterium]|nr:cob(I)yrinic acid a,c-diamide adenosyltransferase [Negativicutes bacterium]